MSLYDKASLVFSSKAAAGKDGKAYNIKPVEKLKVDERITNGSFDNNDADGAWVLLDSPTISNNQAVFYDDSTGTNATKRIYQNNVFEDGKTYKVSFEVVDLKAGRVKVGTGFNTTAITKSNHVTKSGKYSFYYTAQVVSNADARIQISRTDVTGPYDFKIDNVSVREVEQKAVDFTMVRGSNLTATREAPSGLIEKGRENLLLQSNQFDTTWIPNNTSETGGRSGYDGSTNAWELKMTGTQSGTNEARVRQDGLSVSGVCTYSVYAKAGNVNWVRLLGVVAGSTNPWAYFDLSGNGAVGTTSSSVIDTSIESIGSGWFRVSVTYPGAANDLEDVRIIIADADESPYVAQNSYIYIQNAQLEQGLVATPYINTTDSYSKKTAGVLENEPRYDYSGGDATLLLEPERQNLVPHSEYLDSWAFSGNENSVFSFTQNHSTSPDGTKNASRYSATVNYRSIRNILTLETSTDYVFSFYVKNIDATRARYRVYNASPGYGGDVISATDYFPSVSTSEWTRIEVPFTTDANGTSYGVYLADGLTVTNSGDSGGDILFWGAQVEKGSYATSYIPTYGSAATREGEGDSLSSFTCTLDKPLSKKYTLFLDLQVDNLERPTTNFDDIFVARAADGNNYAFRLEGYHDPAPNPDTYSLRAFMYKSGQSFAFLSTEHTNGIQLGVRNKIAIVFDEEVGVKVFHNGALEKEKLEAASFYDVKFLEGGSQPRSKTLLHGVQAYDVALSDPECVSLTTI